MIVAITVIRGIFIVIAFIKALYFPSCQDSSLSTEEDCLSVNREANRSHSLKSKYLPKAHLIGSSPQLQAINLPPWPHQSGVAESEGN